MTTGKTIALTIWTFVGNIMSLLFNMLSRVVIAFLPRNECLLISWLQSPSAVILKPKKIKKKKSVTVSIVSLFICHEVMEPAAKKTFSLPYIEINFPDKVFLAENAHFQHLEYVIPLSPDL